MPPVSGADEDEDDDDDDGAGGDDKHSESDKSETRLSELSDSSPKLTNTTSDHVKYVVYILSPQCGILLVYFIHYEIVHSENFVVRPRNLYLVVMLLNIDLLIILF